MTREFHFECNSPAIRRGERIGKSRTSYDLQVHDFAQRWVDRFSDPSVGYRDLYGNMLMHDECEALGFEMDCGHSFSERYGDAAFNDCDALVGIVDDIMDARILGNAIHSQWRYHNHWNSDFDGDGPESRRWFVIALKRLAELTQPS